jgi:formylglycine-generating enzyme required for sulfatase activity
MKYCVVDGSRYPDERSKCRMCGGPLIDAALMENLPEDGVAILFTSCCPNPSCASLIAPAKVNYCALCGVKLEPISYELWQKKIVKPAIEKSSANVLLNPTSLLRPVAELGLSVSVARGHLNSMLEELTGVPRNVLDGWIEVTTRLLQEKQKREAAQQEAIRQARKLNIRLLPSMAIMEELARKIEVPTEASLPIKDSTPVVKPTNNPPSKSSIRLLKMRKREKTEIPESPMDEVVFPASAADCLVKTKSHSRVVRHDVARSLLIAGPNGNGELSLICNNTHSKNGDSFLVLPRIIRFSSADTFHYFYKEYYDCAKPSAGEVWIIDPATVTEVQGGWQLREKGKLEIDHVAKMPPTVPDQEPEGGKVEHDKALQELPVVLPLIERRVHLIIGIVAGLILLAAILIGIYIGPNRSVENRNPSPTFSFPTNMVFVPGGEFQMGNDAGDTYERPKHRVTVKPFYIDIYEVTCEEYLKFVKATGHRTPSNWIGTNYPDGAAKKPVTGVDWDDASAYAKWTGKRLPTEEEWEFAARGTDERRYSWGNVWRAGLANAGNLKVGQFTDVGSYPDGKSPFGAMDMIGNAWEWTATEWHAYPGGPTLANASSESRVIRGGFWGSSSPKATTTFRRGWQSRGEREGYQNTGFRCAADLAEQTGQK